MVLFGWCAVVRGGQVWRENGLFSKPAMASCCGIAIFISRALNKAPAAISSLQAAYADLESAQKRLDGAAEDKARARVKAAIAALISAQNR